MFVTIKTNSGSVYRLENLETLVEAKLLFCTGSFITIIAELVWSESVFRLVNGGSAVLAIDFAV